MGRATAQASEAVTHASEILPTEIAVVLVTARLRVVVEMLERVGQVRAFERHLVVIVEGVAERGVDVDAAGRRIGILSVEARHDAQVVIPIRRRYAPLE